MGIKKKIMSSIIPCIGTLFQAPKVLPVIYYHDIVGEGEGYSLMHTEISHFEEQMRYLCEEKFDTQLFSQLPLEMNKKKNEKKILITFDDGFLSNYTLAFPIMKKYGLRFNVFLAYDYIGAEGYLSIEQITEMQASGLVEFGYHTKTHCDCRKLSDHEMFDMELVEGKKMLEALLKCKVNDFCFPFGYYTKEVIAKAAQMNLFKHMYTSNYIKPTCVQSSVVCGRIGVDNAWLLDMFKKQIAGKYRILYYYSKMRVGVPKVK